MIEITVLFGFIVGFYIAVSLFGVSSLVLDIYARKKNIDDVPLYRTFIYKTFKISHLPLALVSIVVSVINQAETGDGTLLIILTVFILISLTCEITRGFLDIEYYNNDVITSGSEYDHVYKAVSNYYDTKTERIKSCQKTVEKFTMLTDEINNHLIVINSAYNGISDYMQIQKDECVSLRDSRDICISIFNILEESVRKCNEYFIGFINQIKSSSASIKYCAESKALLGDINTSFKGEFQHQSEYVINEINLVINRINEASNKCSQFNRLFVLYDDIIHSYSGRLEASLYNKPVAIYSEEGEPITLSDFIENIINIKKKDDIKTVKNINKQNDIETIANMNYIALSEKKVEIDKLKNEISNMRKDNSENIDKITTVAKNRKKGLIAVIILSILIQIITISIINNTKNELTNININLLNDNKYLSEKSNEIQTQYDEYMKIARKVISINVLRIGNWSNDRWINAPGNRLNASEVRALRPQINYNSIINEQITMFVKIINPSGTVVRNNTSPDGFTYSHVFTISSGQHTFNLPGWVGQYVNGDYTIQIYYNDFLLISEMVTLY